MTQKLTLAQLLSKHLNEGPHGTATKMARAINTDRQRLYEWASGEVTPRKAMAQTIVEYLRSLKQQAPKNRLRKADN
jgi:succinate dehydrogenase flavin-adding protein (antitoxin of CptAB toxin-antitoxin module)